MYVCMRLHVMRPGLSGCLVAFLQLVAAYKLFVAIRTRFAYNVFNSTAYIGNPFVDATRRQDFAAWLVLAILPFSFRMVARSTAPILGLGWNFGNVLAWGAGCTRGAFTIGCFGGCFGFELQLKVAFPCRAANAVRRRGRSF